MRERIHRAGGLVGFDDRDLLQMKKPPGVGGFGGVLVNGYDVEGLPEIQQEAEGE